MNWKPGVLCRPSLPCPAEYVSQGQTADPLWCPNLQRKSKNLSLPLKTKTKTKTQCSRVNTLQLEIKTSQVWVTSSTGNVTHLWLMNLAPWNMLKMSGFPGNANQIKDAYRYCFTVARWIWECAAVTSVTLQKCAHRPQKRAQPLHFDRTARDHTLCWS